jgi:dynein heavy chain
LDNKLICYVEDLHMSWTDPYGDQPAVEAVRDYLTQRAWLSPRKRRVREIEDVSFFACLASNAPETAQVSGRVLHQFNLISLDEPSVGTMTSMFRALTDMLVLDWPSAIQPYSANIVKAVVDVSLRVFGHLKPTPMKAHYTFTWRDVGKILLTLQKIESNSLKKQAHVMKLLFHECYRNYGDRLLMAHDKTWFTETLEEVCREHFYVVDDEALVKAAAAKKEEGAADKGEEGAEGEDGAADDALPGRKDPFLWPIPDPDQLFYSQWNHEVDGFYMEVDPIETVQKVI